MTGSVPCKALFISPLASYGVTGKTTFKPGIWATSEVQSWECCAPYFDPTETLKTTGILRTFPLIACHFGSWLKTSSPHLPRKSQYMISGITRPPHIAYPIAVHTIEASEIGELN